MRISDARGDSGSHDDHMHRGPMAGIRPVFRATSFRRHMGRARRQISEEPPSIVPLIEELRPAPDVESALQAFQPLPDVLLLESALTREHVGRYSFLMADPYAFFETNPVIYGEDPLEPIRRAMSAFRAPLRPGLPPFQGGAAGLVSYSAGMAWEQLPAPAYREFGLPDVAIGLYDWVIAWDHFEGRAWIISQGFPAIEPADRHARAAERLEFAKDVLRRGTSDSAPQRATSPRLDSRMLAPQWPAPGPEGLSSTFSREGYLGAVARAIEYIHAGDVFQVNLAQRLLFPARGEPVDLYLRLRRRNPAPFAGYFAHADWAIASASPERFVALQAGEVETRPIKGTRQRQTGPEADLFTRDELRESEKDQAENLMIVDLLRNDLSRVCQPGSIRVPELCSVETYATVQHLVSQIRGTLASGRDAWDLIRAAFPGGSITGAPKVRAMQIISELEPTARGPYCGSLMYVGFDGQMDSSILIRTFVISQGWIQCHVGGGVVAQSNPVAEYEETLHKAAGMLRALA